MKKRLIIAIIGIMLMSGCTAARYVTPDGTDVFVGTCVTDFKGIKGKSPTGWELDIIGMETDFEAGLRTGINIYKMGAGGVQ